MFANRWRVQLQLRQMVRWQQEGSSKQLRDSRAIYQFLATEQEESKSQRAYAAGLNRAPSEAPLV